MYKGNIKKGYNPQQSVSTFKHIDTSANPFNLAETQRLNENLETFLPKHNQYKINKSQKYVQDQKKNNSNLASLNSVKNKNSTFFSKSQSSFDKNQPPIEFGKMPDYRKASLQKQNYDILFRGTNQDLKMQLNKQQQENIMSEGLKDLISFPNKSHMNNHKQIYQHKLHSLQNGQQLMQKIEQKLQQQKQKRQNLIKGFTLLSEEGTNKLDHTIKVMNILERDLSDKILEYPNIYTSIEKLFDTFQQVNYTFQHIYDQIFQQNQDILQLKDFIQAQNDRIDLLAEQKKEINEMLAEKSKILKKFIIENDPKNRIAQKNSNFLGLENQKLGEELVQLASKVREIETGEDRQNLEEKVSNLEFALKKQQNDFYNEMDTQKREYQKLKASHTTLTTYFQRQKTELNSISQLYELNQKELDKLKKENQKNLAAANQYREKSLMQLEDLLGYKQKTYSDKVMISTLSKKNQELKSRLDKFHLQRSKQVEIPYYEDQIEETNKFFGKQEKTFREEVSFKKKLFDQYEADKIIMNDPIKEKIMEKWKDTLQIQQQQQQSSGQQQSVDLKKIQLMWPNYYIFVEAQIKHHELEINNISTRKISLSYLATLRSILDCKFKEIMLLQDNYKQMSRFPDFVYSWFQNYTVDDRTKKLRFSNKNEILQADETRIAFLLDLLNPKLQSLWEFQTFKEFLGEYTSKDELYFYLHCRHLLFQGDVMDYNNAPFEVIIYLKLEQADKILDCIMKKYETMSIVHLKAEMRSRVKKKTIKKRILKPTDTDPNAYEEIEIVIQLIDSALILRLLLQYYKIERQARYKNLSEAFSAVQSIDKHGKFTTSFSNFKKIVEMTFPRVLQIELAEMYRECYAIGSGSVTSDTFFAVASDNGFFIKQLKLPGYKIKAPIIQTVKQTVSVQQDEIMGGGYKDMKIISNELTNDDQNMDYNVFYSTYDRLKQYIDPLLEIGKKYGVETLQAQIKEIQELIESKFCKPDIDELMKGRPLIFWVHQLMKILQDIKNIIYYNKQLEDKNQHYFILDSDQMIINDFSVIETTLRTTLDYYKTQKQELDYKNNTVKKMQTAFLYKIKKFYTTVSSLLQANFAFTQFKAQAKNPQLDSKKYDVHGINYNMNTQNTGGNNTPKVGTPQIKNRADLKKSESKFALQNKK